MADFGMETLPPVKGHKFSIVLLQLTVMLVNAIDRLHKGGVAITKYWVHVQEYENILEYLASGSEAFYGINLDPKNATARLRLEEFPLHVRSVLNPHLGRSPGINVPSLYAGLKGSCSAMHCEDGDLDSGNIHRYGAPKYWLFVHPHYNHHLRQRVLEAIRKSTKKDLTRKWLPGCGTPLHHKRLLLAPSLLREWDIPFEIHVQQPGQFIYIRDGVYHQVVNAGPCIAEAVNMGGALWSGGAHKFKSCGCNSSGKAEFVSGNPDVAFNVKTVPLKRHVCDSPGCDAYYFDLRELAAHKRAHTRTVHTCTICRRSFVRPSELRRHSKVHLPSEETRVQCSVCQGFVRKDYMRVHRLTCRGGSLACPYCSKTFPRRETLTLHSSKCASRR
ncbi:hypothetical protein QAD02_003400 [Eretmocerus hayati]|uniref:Uncharacterized protein n=1 Tax=Eretmocerus hayati TaxID=131215 RepID=A0ACC2NLZ3_9HYME|nr:hypothetical protein QAD02_003400 [Eretmocerus hayati]